MSDSNVRLIGMSLGLGILFMTLVIELVELGIVASIDNNEMKCAEQLFTWVYVSTIIGTLSNGFYLLYYCCFMYTLAGCKGQSDTGSMTIGCFCFTGGICVSCMVCIVVAFRIAWFVYGIYLMDILDDQCKDSIGSAYGIIIAGLVSMVFSTFAKIIVTFIAMMG